MSNIKMIAVDLDDTLLRTDLSISWRTRRTIRSAQKAGIVVVIASGRVLNAMLQYIKQLNMQKYGSYIICGNGTTIHEAKNLTIIEQITIPDKIALAAFDLANAEGFAVQLYRNNKIYVSRSNEFSELDYKLTGIADVVSPDFRDMVADNTDKLVIPGDPMLLRPLETLMRNMLGETATLFTSKPYYLEVLPPKTDKGSALKKIAGMLGIERENVMAFGDSMNDEAMLRWAGWSVAMVNGDERVRNVAKCISDFSNDDDGVAKMIEKYALKA
ncbi:MAG: sugar-phosphatase [Termitinemataceae bacterium]|nr:MAG: sugar-phosphatase [Termitinemataceae bacterium]